MLLELFVLCLVGTLLVWLVRRRQRCRLLPPLSPESLWHNVSSKGYQRLMNFHNQSQWCQRCSNQDTRSGSVFRQRMPLTCHFVACCDYKLARILLAGSTDGQIQESEKTKRLQNLNLFPGICSLLTYQTANPERAQLRKHLYAPFSTLNLQKTTVQILGKGVQRLLRHLKDCASRGEVVDMKKTAVQITFDVLTRSLFDISLDDCDVFTADEFLAAQDAAMREAVMLFLNPWHRHMTWLEGVKRGIQGEKELRQFGKLIIDRYKAEQSSKQKNEKTIMSHIISYDYPSEEHRISDVIVFMIAGHETTAHTLSFFLYCLAKNCEVQKKLQRELDVITPTGGADGEEFLNISDIAGAEYFNNCLKESQRLYPVAPIISRNASVDIKYNGMIIPKGSIVAVVIASMMRQDWICDADAYIPERWEDDSPQVKELKEMFIPFSVGKRSCIGQNLALLELRVIASNIIRNFDIELLSEPDIDMFITMKPVDFHLKFSLREKSVNR